MIAIQQKQFQIVLWATKDRTGSALHLSFDTLEEAKSGWEAQRSSGTFHTGIMMEWRKSTGTWQLIDQF